MPSSGPRWHSPRAAEKNNENNGNNGLEELSDFKLLASKMLVPIVALERLEGFERSGRLVRKKYSSIHTQNALQTLIPELAPGFPN